MLSLSNLKVDIEGSRILNGISLNVAAGELVCLVGRNGAGKTTTFRSIMGYVQPVSGTIDFQGKAIVGYLRVPEGKRPCPCHDHVGRT